MAKERLSKLQKWILVQTYKLEVLHDSGVVGKVGRVTTIKMALISTVWVFFDGAKYQSQFDKPHINDVKFIKPTKYASVALD